MSADLEVNVAVLSDIHGNVWALEAVLADLDRREVFEIVNLGDCLYGPLAPRAVADILVEKEILTVSGNEDRLILEGKDGHDRAPILDFVRAELTDRHLAWLECLPAAATFGDALFLCHGTPADDTSYLLREPAAGLTRPRGPAEIAAALQNVQHSVVLCGHDHSPGKVLLPDGRLIVNPGSVGLQAYVDDHPCPHRIENSSPHARYCVLSRRSGKWSVKAVALKYDWEEAARAASANGRSDWAAWLRTGRSHLASKPPR